MVNCIKKHHSFLDFEQAQVRTGVASFLVQNAYTATHSHICSNWIPSLSSPVFEKQLRLSWWVTVSLQIRIVTKIIHIGIYYENGLSM
jgi:hypothetical protein